MVASAGALCGVGHYARSLADALAAHADVRFVGLDPAITRGASPALAERLIGDCVAQIGECDAACLQVEWGILGGDTRAVRRRFAALLDAAPAAVVALHTVIRPGLQDWAGLAKLAASGRIGAALARHGTHAYEQRLAAPVYRDLAQRQARQKLGLVVHTPSDRAMLGDLFGIANVHDHPLVYLSEEDIRRIGDLPPHPIRERLPAGSHLSGAFGFISDYKGIDVALAALRELPAHHHLAIFGGVHPNLIGHDINPTLAGLLAQCDDALRGRVHFMGAVSDEEFLRGMLACDAVLTPYRETGFSGSGPASLAMELGCRVIASRTRGFLELSSYFPDRLELVDIGSFMELATRLASPPAARSASYVRRYSVESNARLYLSAMGIDVGS